MRRLPHAVSGASFHCHARTHRAGCGSDACVCEQGSGRLVGKARMNLAERARQLLSLEGKVAMVTGAASGIGRGIAIRLAEMGASVAVLDVNEEGGLETVASVTAGKGRGVFVKYHVPNHVPFPNP